MLDNLKQKRCEYGNVEVPSKYLQKQFKKCVLISELFNDIIEEQISQSVYIKRMQRIC